LLVVLDAALAATRLASGRLQCPGCSSPLAPWGRARRRTLRGLAGTAVSLQPQRARCTACRATHVVLPAAVLPHRSDIIEVISAALLHNALGAGHRTIADRLGLPSETVRGWLRRAAHQGEGWRRVAMSLLYQFDPSHGPVNPRRSPTADMVEALTLVAAAACRRLGSRGTTWEFVAAFTARRFLSRSPSTA
jgi:transposase-like protein